MKFESPQTVEQLVWTMKLADYPRALNRSKINNLLEGWPPYSEEEANANNISTNVAFPENGPNIAHDARRQLDNALLLPDPLFMIDADYGAQWQKRQWSSIVTKEINKIIRKSRGYHDTQTSVNALNIAHAIGPTVWPGRYAWRPRCRGIEDVLIPSGTLLNMDDESLPFFAVYEKYTAYELWRMTHGPKVDPGWNLPMVDAAIKWAHQESVKLMGTSWPETWSPEKVDMLMKENGGWYSTDKVPTIDTFHFYWYDDEDRQSGWRKKIILDIWGNPGPGSIGGIQMDKVSGKYGYKGSAFLYDSQKRKFADKLDQIIHFQVANCSNQAPFHYHAARSLGWLLHAVCQLQNRLQCRFSDATFESMMQYFRVSNMGDAERALRIDLTDGQALPDGISFVSPNERWKVNEGMIQMALKINRTSIDDSAGSYAQDFDPEAGQNETATRTMARLNNNAAMVAGMTNQAYTGKKFQYQEICRRFCIKNSRDPDVKKFRVTVLSQGVPEEALNIECWDIKPTRIIGNGNKLLQSAMVDRAMMVYTKLDPTAQRQVLRMKLAVDFDDYSLAQDLVPDQPHVSDSVHDAQLSAGVMLSGNRMALKEGVNHSEYIEAMLMAMASKVQQLAQGGGIGNPADIMGLQNLAGRSIQGQPIPGNGIQNHIAILAQDEKQPHYKGQQPDHSVKEMVKRYSDTLNVLMNQVKAFAQRMAEQMQKRNGQGDPMDPKDAAKIKAIELQAKVKAQNASTSHAQRTAQRQITFEQKTRQDADKHRMDLTKEAIETAHAVAINRLKSFHE